MRLTGPYSPVFYAFNGAKFSGGLHNNKIPEIIEITGSGSAPRAARNWAYRKIKRLLKDLKLKLVSGKTRLEGDERSGFKYHIFFRHDKTNEQ